MVIKQVIWVLYVCYMSYISYESYRSPFYELLNPIQYRGVVPVPVFFAVTSTNVGNSPKNSLNFSFKPFLTLV